ncbi:MAG: NADAR family protein [Acetobacter sp.]|nr:NADAR family protein [Acetobacter sp.]
MEKISDFRGKYAILSNFGETHFEFGGVVWTSSEAAFQASKTKDLMKQIEISRMTPAEAKRVGRHLELRPDWEQVKDTVMLAVVFEKFSQDKQAQAALLSTGDAYLEEGNTWGDKYWGVCNGVGLNKLGKILMQVREEIRASQPETDERILELAKLLFKHANQYVCNHCGCFDSCKRMAFGDCGTFENIAEHLYAEGVRIVKE